jgi:hypothetical protein
LAVEPANARAEELRKLAPRGQLEKLSRQFKEAASSAALKDEWSLALKRAGAAVTIGQASRGIGPIKRFLEGLGRRGGLPGHELEAVAIRNAQARPWQSLAFYAKALLRVLALMLFVAGVATIAFSAVLWVYGDPVNEVTSEVTTETLIDTKDVKGGEVTAGTASEDKSKAITENKTTKTSTKMTSERSEVYSVALLVAGIALLLVGSFFTRLQEIEITKDGLKLKIAEAEERVRKAVDEAPPEAKEAAMAVAAQAAEELRVLREWVSS